MAFMFYCFFKEIIICLNRQNNIEHFNKIHYSKTKLMKRKESLINFHKSKANDKYKKCYLPLDESNMKIIHLIITRFLLEFFILNDFPKKLYNEKYIPNAIRVMKKYLFPSLENQSCKDFIWILLLGNKANITYIKSLFNFNFSFKISVIYKKEFKKYLKNITKGFNILITTRYDYDDRIYYDAVNDVRKSININKPMLLFGYNRGLYYFEKNDKYYEYYYNFKNKGVMSIFISLVVVLNKVNDTYTIYDLGDHRYIKKELKKKYKSFGIKKMNYDPSVFDSGSPKFVWVRQNYSGYYKETEKVINNSKAINFNLNKFYGE